MDMNTKVSFDDSRYSLTKFDRPTSAPTHNPSTVIKYIVPRVLTSNVSNSFQGSSRGIAWSNVGSHFPPTTTSLGLASLIQSSTFTTLSPLHSIDGQRIIDEHRELSRITETLGDVIVQCSNLEAHNGAQQLQIEWLRARSYENGLSIEKMFQTEIESAKKLIQEGLQHKPPLQTRMNEVDRTTNAYDEQYQQLLSKRNALSKDLFDLERQIAQNSAESIFLQRRVAHLDDESKFYTFKNHLLHARKVRLRYELDEEVYSQQSLSVEFEVLKNEKITQEDVHVTTIDNIHNSIDITQIAGIQPLKHYSSQLKQEIQQIRNTYEKKLEIYREELHRRFELELHRYKMYKTRPLPGITKEHQLTLEQHLQEKKEVVQQRAVLHGRINEIIAQIETIEKQIMSEKTNQQIVNSKKDFSMINQIVRDRERQLDEVLRVRGELKQQIANYKERLNRYARERTLNYSDKRTSFQEINELTNRRSIFRSSIQELTSEYNEQERSITSRVPPSIIVSPASPVQRSKRSSLQELTNEYNEQERSIISRVPSSIIVSPASPVQHSKRLSAIQFDELWEEGTLTKYNDFKLDQDCEELRRSLNNTNKDELGVIRILCNRSVGQRLQIRDKYRKIFNANLSDALDTIVNDNLSKLLRILLLSPIERDCFELRRIIKSSNMDETILVEILFSRSNKHIQALRDTYHKLFRNTLEQDIIGYQDDYSKRIFCTLLQTNRPEYNDVNDNEIIRDAKELYETGTKWRTDVSTFLRLLCTRSNTQLRKIFAAYQQFSNRDIEQAIQVNTDGNLYHTFMAIVRIIRNRPRFFAYGLKKSLKGITTNEDNLNRIIVSRCEIDMVQIKSEYEKIARRTLYSHIQADIVGNYKRALLELLRQRIEPNTVELTFQSSDDQIDLSKRRNFDQSQVQWRNSLLTIPSPFARSSSERTLNRQSRGNSPFDYNNQAKSTSLSTINTKQVKTQYISRRQFVPLGRNAGSNSQLYDDDDEEEEEEEE